MKEKIFFLVGRVWESLKEKILENKRLAIGACIFLLVSGGVCLAAKKSKKFGNFLISMTEGISQNTSNQKTSGSVSGANKISSTLVAPAKTCSFQTSSSPTRTTLVFKEIAWMGDSDSADDEWLLVQKISTGSLDVSGYQVLNENEKIKIALPAKTVLSDTKPIFVMARKDGIAGIKADLIYSGALKNSNEGLRLFDSGCNLLDEVLANPSWPGGDNKTKQTLKRNLNTLAWYTTADQLAAIVAAQNIVTENSSSDNQATTSQTVTIGQVLGASTSTIVSAASTTLATTTQAPGKININTASKSELIQLKGIGDTKAQAVIDYRSTKGPFYYIGDIMKVYGIGPAIFAGIKDQITVGNISPPPSEVQPPPPADPGPTPTLPPSPTPVFFTLSVSKTGVGFGSISGGTINCGAGCVEDSDDFASATIVQLTAMADQGSEFSGWSGACSGAGSCSLTMDGAKAVGAIFNLTVAPDPEPTPTPAADSKILIEEVMPRSQASTYDSFIVLYNAGQTDADLTGWTIKKKTSTGNESDLVATSHLSGKTILAGKYFLLANDGGYTGSVSPDAVWAHSYTLASTNNAVIIYDQNGSTVDTAAWTSVPQSSSYTRVSNQSLDFVVQDTPSPKNSLSN